MFEIAKYFNVHYSTVSRADLLVFLQNVMIDCGAVLVLLNGLAIIWWLWRVGHMRIVLTLLSIFFVNNFAYASDFELTVYFDLNIAEKHGIVQCRPGGLGSTTDYHLTIFKDKPSYTILGNLDLDKDIAGDVERNYLCDKGEFTLIKSINTTEDFINLFVYLEEIYIMKDEIFEVANVKLSSDEDYFIQKKYISESGQTAVETRNVKEVMSSTGDNAIKENGDLLYSIEITRKK